RRRGAGVGDRSCRRGDDARHPAAHHSSGFGGAGSLGFAGAFAGLPVVEDVGFFFAPLALPRLVVGACACGGSIGSARAATGVTGATTVVAGRGLASSNALTIPGQSSARGVMPAIVSPLNQNQYGLAVMRIVSLLFSSPLNVSCVTGTTQPRIDDGVPSIGQSPGSGGATLTRVFFCGRSLNAR